MKTAESLSPSWEAETDSVGISMFALLALHPRAPVAAVREDGIFTAMPESVLLAGHPVLKACSALDLVAAQDQGAVIGAWDRTLATGSGRCSVRLVSDPDSNMMFYAFDTRPSHGVLLVTFVPSELARDSSAAEGRELASAVPKVATTRKDERAVYVAVDDATTQILGWTADQMEGRRSLEFIHPDDHALAIENWMEMLAASGPARRVRLRHQRDDGSWVWFEVTNQNLLEDPAHGCVVCGMVDITDEMAIHEELRAREQLLDRLAEAMPLGLFQIDAAREVVYTNDRLHQIIETDRSKGVDDQLTAITASDRPLLKQALDRVLGDGDAADIEVTLRLPRSGESRYCAINLRPLSDEAGAISGAIGCLADITDSARLRDELTRRATFDALTGCYNRASLMLALEAHMTTQQAGANRAVIFVDLDRFKQINDEFGHAAGDELLMVVTERLRNAIRTGDIVGRIGGDEFLIMCPGIGSAEQAMELAERLSATLCTKLRLGDRALAPGASIGVAWSTGEQPDAETLVALADRAMYASKRERAGRPMLAPSCDEAQIAQ